jgi:DHA2 family multidrug resistance protein
MNNEVPKVNPWLIAAAVVLPTFMEVLDSSIVSVALSNIAGSLSVSSSQATWVQTSYLISNAVVLPASAWFSGFFGRKRFFLTSIAIFTAASFMCGFAPSLGILVLARVLQGIGGGALVPLSLAILLETFPKEKRGQATAAWGMAVVVAPVLGPLLGGWITENYSWPWLFYINVPVGVVALWMIQQFIDDPEYLRDGKPGKIDAVGFGLLTLWLSTLQIVLDKGQDADWFGAVWIRWFSAVSAVSLVALVIWELRSAVPIMNLRVLKNRNFFLGTVLNTVFGAVVYSPQTLLPLFLQTLLNYTSFQSGLAQYPRGIGSLLALPLVGFLSRRVDNRMLIFVGTILTGVSSLMMGDINLEVAKSSFALANLVQGAGIALTFVPLTTMAMGLLRNEEMGNASGIYNLMRNLGGSIGISMVTTMATRGAQAHQAYLVSHVTPYDTTYQTALNHAQTTLAQSVGPAQAQLMAPGAIYNGLLQQSALFAYVDDFRWLAMVSFVSLLAVLWMKRVSAHKGTISMH